MIQTATPSSRQETNSFLAGFDFFEKSRAGQEPSWLHAIRKSAISHFAELGFPTTHHEEWLFTNVAPIAKLPFKPVFEPTSGLTLKDIERFTFGGQNCNRLVFVNGHFSQELSSIRKYDDGILIGSLVNALAKQWNVLEAHLGRHARFDENAFAALNTAMFTDGGFVFVPKGKVIKEPIHFLFLVNSLEAGITVQPRNLIVCERDSQAKVVESYVSLSDGVCFTNAITEIAMDEAAHLEHCKLQGENQESFHVATIHASQAKNSNLTTHSISTGARLARNNLYLSLEGEGIESILNGLYLATDNQLVDHHTVVDHASPHCNSHEFYHGILDGKSRGVFNGKIFVRKDAQKTDAKQTNRNLLLSDDATVDAKPQLEIFADDVKCTHGATIGQLDEEAIFYLRARGIGHDLARQILIHAFASEIMDRIHIPEVRERLDDLVAGGLEQHLPSIY
jgi:Fe-S cluster assembly protein SufD